MKSSAFLSVAIGSIAIVSTVGAQTTATHHPAAGHGVVRASAARSASSITMRRDGLRTVTVTASDYAFSAPDTIPAGMTEIRLLNRGSEMHHVWMIRIEGGKSLKDLFAVMKPDAPLPSWARDVGGPNTPGPGGEANAILRLTPGRYAMICVIPSPDGKPHIMKGMAKEVTVVPSVPPTASANLQIASTMTLLDYTFQFSQPLSAGRQMIRVKNTAAQPHEVVFVKLQPGKKTADVLAWMEKMQGPPPGAPIGGTTPMAKGEENIVTLDLTPGEYGMICFVGDAKDGKPHFMHGMIMEFTVPASK
jgi:hypothetical protein